MLPFKEPLDIAVVTRGGAGFSLGALDSSLQSEDAEPRHPRGECRLQKAGSSCQRIIIRCP